MTGSSALAMSNRRREMLRLQRLGVEPKEFIQIVASKFGVEVDAVRRDWSNRTKWMQAFLCEEDSRKLVLAQLLDYDVLQQEASLLFNKEENSKTKVQLIYALLKIIDRKTEILRQLGAFEMLKYDYESKAKEHARKLLEEEFPWMKGNRDLLNASLALAKVSGRYSIIDLLKFEEECADAP